MMVLLSILGIGASADVTDWILAVSSAVAALGALGGFLVALWVAVRSRHAPLDSSPGDLGAVQGRRRSGSARLLRWALRLLAKPEAARYGHEWGAHLHELEENGEHVQAARDRWRLALRATAFAAELRLRSAWLAVRRRIR